jgi:acetyl esterase/lipase
MGSERRRVRSLIVAVFVPVVVVIGVLASAVLGDGGADRPTALPTPALDRAPAPPAVTPPGQDPGLTPVPAPAPASAPAPAPPPSAAEPGPSLAPDPEPDPEFSTDFVPDGARRLDVGSGAQGAAIFLPVRTAGRPGPVVIFLHGWVALDPRRYGPWIAHLVRRGTTVIYPAYQTKPAYDTITPLADALAGVRLALDQVDLAPGRLVTAGHSAGGALAADYAAVAASEGLPAPAAVFSVYPGRKLRHLPVPIPTANLAAIARGTRLLVFAGERDTAVGSEPARRIAALATNADTTLRIIADDDVDEHSAPRSYDGAAQRTFWAPLDALVEATASGSGTASGP